MPDTRDQLASRLMDAFALDTGVIGDRPPLRYLWTDAHAVCNWLRLAQTLGDQRYLDLAIGLVAQVHEVLGRHRPDDRRTGWISGLPEEEGRQHPTAGGLRIGKPQPERQADAPPDERAEWVQDGQYYHYLTKWMHALAQMACQTDDASYLRWAVELAVTAHRGFRASSGPPRLFWKMSIDLTYPLVASSGHHDPLDGLITCLELEHQQPYPELDPVITDLTNLCHGRSWLTDDPLGIGGLLFDAGRLAQLHHEATDPQSAGLEAQLLQDAATGLEYFLQTDPLRRAADHRLAFRELGLAIGLQGYDIIQACDPGGDTQRALDRLKPFIGLQTLIENFWLQAGNQQARSWSEHLDINRVTLATSLTAAGYLSI